MKAKTEEQLEARLRRSCGDSIIAIARDLEVSRSSVSVWVRDVVRPPTEAPRDPFDDAATLLDEGSELICGRCRRLLPSSAFNRMGPGYQYWCRECFRQYQLDRRDRNAVQVSEATRRRRARAQEQVAAHLAAARCPDCGEDDVVVLELDHVLGSKTGGVADMTHRGASAIALAAELAKCDVVCASCHRVRTATRAGTFRILGERCVSWPQKSPSQRRAMRFVGDDLVGRSCVDCGEERAACLDYDHLGDKTMNVAELVCQGASNERIATEIAKCEVRCASCHRRRTEWARESWRTRLPGARRSVAAASGYPVRELNPPPPP